MDSGLIMQKLAQLETSSLTNCGPPGCPTNGLSALCGLAGLPPWQVKGLGMSHALFCFVAFMQWRLELVMLHACGLWPACGHPLMTVVKYIC